MIFPLSENTRLNRNAICSLLSKWAPKKRFAVLPTPTPACRDPSRGLFCLETLQLEPCLELVHSCSQLWTVMNSAHSQCAYKHWCSGGFSLIQLAVHVLTPAESGNVEIFNSRLPLLLHRPTPGLFHLQTDRQIKQSVCCERIEVLCAVDGIVANRNCTLMTVWVKPYN